MIGGAELSSLNAAATFATARVATAPASRLIGEAEFASLYAAAEFAAAHDLWLDTSITLTWSKLGLAGDAEIQASFTSFQKCLRAWLDEHRIVTAYVYSHEHSRKVGAHTHMLVYLPADRYFRQEFRAWLRGWAERHVGRAAPRAVRVRGQLKSTPWLHWHLFGYLVKGYDRSAVVQSGRNTPDGRDVMLGDLIHRPWAEPGPVTLKKRVGWSKSLGPERRAVGVPIGLERMFRTPPPVNTLRIDGPQASQEPRDIAPPDLRPTATPFRSSYEDGVRDARKLYPAEFLAKMTSLIAPAADIAE